jgi:anti-sigma factor RsiW
MMTNFATAELEAYLDEALPVEQMTAIERASRSQPELLQRLAQINGRRDAGVHSLGEIWRRQRLSCPTRQQLGSYLLGVVPDEQADYIRFHIDTVGCRFCAANLADLQAQQAEAADHAHRRRRKYFQSSAGFLRKC